MTVYIEYVLIDNFLIDYFLLKASFTLTGVSCVRKRLLFCAFLGALLSLVFPLITVNTIFQTLLKLLSGALIVVIAGKFCSLKQIYINVLVFYFYTFLLGGAIIGIFSIFNIPYSLEISIALMTLPFFIVYSFLNKVVRFLYSRKNTECFIYDVEISVLKNTVKCRGFLDTGNCLYDGERPVIVCSKSFAFKILGNKLGFVKLKEIQVNTVNGSSKNIAFEIDSIKIYNGQDVNIFNNVTICVTNKTFNNGYQIILHPALYKGEENEKIDFKTKKIS